MEENRPARGLGAENANIPPGDDYEYDEAHCVAGGPPGGIDPPTKGNFGAGGDYQYDEAHDFGASRSAQHTNAYCGRLPTVTASENDRGALGALRNRL